MEPLKELLTTGISPFALAKQLDTILINYARMALDLQERCVGEDVYVHPEATRHIYYLEELRNTLRKCQPKKKNS